MCLASDVHQTKHHSLCFTNIAALFLVCIRCLPVHVLHRQCHLASDVHQMFYLTLCFTGVAKAMLACIGKEHLITGQTTLKDCYKLCDQFSKAQEPIHVFTATQLHILYDIPLAELAVRTSFCRSTSRRPPSPSHAFAAMLTHHLNKPITHTCVTKLQPRAACTLAATSKF